MDTGSTLINFFFVLLIIISVTMVLRWAERNFDQRNTERRNTERNHTREERQRWRELSGTRLKQLEAKIASQRSAAAEIAEGKSNLNNPFKDGLDRFFRQSVELRGISLHGQDDNSLKTIARHVAEYREECLYPLLECETNLHRAVFELEFAKALEGPLSVASNKNSIRILSDRIPFLRHKMHDGLRQLRYDVREMSARHRGVPEERALSDADELRAREPHVYPFMEELIYRGGYVDVPQNDIVS